MKFYIAFSDFRFQCIVILAGCICLSIEPPHQELTIVLLNKSILFLPYLTHEIYQNMPFCVLLLTMRKPPIKLDYLVSKWVSSAVYPGQDSNLWPTD